MTLTPDELFEQQKLSLGRGCKLVDAFTFSDELTLVVYDADPIAVDDHTKMFTRRWAVSSREGNGGGIVKAEFRSEEK